MDLRFLGIEATVARDCCGLVESGFENSTSNYSHSPLVNVKYVWTCVEIGLKYVWSELKGDVESFVERASIF